MLIIVGAIVAAGAFFVLEVCTVRDVEVEGNVLYDDETIKNTVLNDKFSTNTLYVFFKNKFSKGEEMPFVDSVEISVSLPHKVHITVYEKGMLGYVYVDSMGQNAYFDKDGIVVEISEKKIKDVPIIKGMSIDEVVLFEKLPADDVMLDTLLNITRSLEKFELVPSSIDVSDSDNMKLKFGKITVEFGDEEYLNEKMTRLSYILGELKGKKGTLYMDFWSPDTTDIVFSEDK